MSLPTVPTRGFCHGLLENADVEVVAPQAETRIEDDIIFLEFPTPGNIFIGDDTYNLSYGFELRATSVVIPLPEDYQLRPEFRRLWLDSFKTWSEVIQDDSGIDFAMHRNADTAIQRE